MENMWESIKRGLQDGAAVAVNKAEELTQLGRARLDIAAAKTRLSRLQSELGSEVYRRLENGEDVAEDPVIRELCGHINACSRELADSKAVFEQIQADLEGPPRDGDDDLSGI